MTGFFHTTIQANADFIIDIGATVASESKDASCSLLLPSGRSVISILPVSSGKAGVFLPLYFILDLSERPNISRKDEHVKLLVHDNSQLYLLVKFPVYSSQSILPHTMCRTNFTYNAKSLRAAVYYNECAVAVIEDSYSNILYALALDNSTQSCKVNVVHRNGVTFAIFEARCEQCVKLAVICVSGKTRLALECECESFHVAEIITVKKCINDAKFLLEYSFTGEHVSLVSARTEQEEGFSCLAAIFCFAQLLQAKSESLVMEMLHTSLRRDVSFSALREYFGEFESIFPSLCDAKSLALVYSEGNFSRIRKFSIAFSGNKISDISE